MTDKLSADPVQIESFSGLRIIESPWFTMTITRTVRRSWRERLWSWPWRPWKATKLIQETVPSDSIYKFGDNTIAMHPVMARRLREELHGHF